MAMNPMQKKARTSFILGVFITILITGIVIVLLLLHTNNLNKEIATMKSNLVKVYKSRCKIRRRINRRHVCNEIC